MRRTSIVPPVNSILEEMDERAMDLYKRLSGAELLPLTPNYREKRNYRKKTMVSEELESSDNELEYSDDSEYSDESEYTEELEYSEGPKYIDPEYENQSTPNIAPVQLYNIATVAPYPKSILFLCSDNLTRGPMAEAIFTRLLFERNIEDQWFVRSGGLISSFKNQEMDERVVTYLAQKTIIPGLHKSKVATTGDLKCFNIIACFDQTDYETALQMAPKCSQHITLLGDFHPTGELNFVGSKNREGPEFRKWISCKEWRKKRTSIHLPIKPSDLEDIKILYEQCHLCCVNLLSYHLNDFVPSCLCIHVTEIRKFEAVTNEKLFSVYSDDDGMLIANEDDNEIEEEDEELEDEEEEQLEFYKCKTKITGQPKKILEYYSKNRLCPNCFKKIPPRILNDGASTSKTS